MSDEEKKHPKEELEKPKSDLASIYEESLKDFRVGQVVKGRIVDITPADVLVDIGYKSEGAIPKEEFPDPHSLKIGDEVEVLFASRENEEGRVVLSKERAARVQGWERIISNCREGDVIHGRVLRKVKGGLIVDVGIEAFLPASLASLRGFTNLDQLLGQSLDFKIVKLNKPRRNVVLSRRDVLQKEKDDSRLEFFGKLEVGQLRPGTVKNITDFGAFVNLGPVDGLLHITDMSWGRISHPSEILAVGDRIDVVILNFDKDNNKVSLGLKQKTPNPWEEVETKYPVGSKVKGKVVNILPYGAFVELEKGVEGLVHISELSWTRRITHPNEVLAIGDVVEAIVLNIDKANQKISLGVKQTEANPWLEIQSKYPAGTKIKGRVRNLTDYGAFLELEEGIDGLIHISDMSWTKRLTHPSEVLKKGQKVEAIVLGVDAENRKISLGLKQVVPDPWPEIVKRYPVGKAIEAQIIKVTNFGVFVELEKDLDGLLHLSEVEPLPPGGIEEAFKVGDTIKVKVHRVDMLQRKIGLTAKGVPTGQ